MQTIRWGIIGCGDVTEVKSGPGFQKANDSSLVAVMRRTGELAKDYAQRHSVPRWYDDAEALIHDSEVDAVYIATPPSSHKTYTLRSAQAARVPLFVAYYRRALRRFLKIKELLDTQAIGEVRFVTLTLYQPLAAEELQPGTLPWRVQPEIAGGGRFVDLAAHMLDFLDYVLGPIRDVQAFSSNQAHRYPAEDIVTSAFVFTSGVQGIGTWCFTSFDRWDQTEIVGSKGKITYSTFDAQPVILTTSQGQEEFTYEYPAHIQQPLIQSVVNALNGKGDCPSTGESAARTTWVMDQMLGRTA